ncbi:3'-5' exonuclease [Saccharopolyspora shandongensis]|uniref:3'-5' exonuclease n=1 Tax=Saccharopolyspora shandongensis TaxID=418495 RepID=UPI003406A277
MITAANLPWYRLNYVVISVQGTGPRVAERPDLVELTAMSIEDGTLDDPVTWELRPDHLITPHAMRAYGTTNRDVRFRPKFAAVAGAIRNYFDVAIPVGHNVRRSLGMLSRKLPEWRPAEAFDTLRMARSAMGVREQRLRILAEQLGLTAGIPDAPGERRTAWDALMTARLFLRLANNSGRPLTVAELRERGQWLCPHPESQMQLLEPGWTQ